MATEPARAVEPVFFYDFTSPYAYLSAHRIDDLLPVRPRWQPFLFGALIIEIGKRPWSLAPGVLSVAQNTISTAQTSAATAISASATSFGTGQTACAARQEKPRPPSPSTMPKNEAGTFGSAMPIRVKSAGFTAL